jgi:type II secretory pathway predicted ATPase ExeA
MTHADPIQTHWGLTSTPFGKDVPDEHLSHHRAHDEAVARIRHAIAHRHIGVIAGETGAGKTLAVRAALRGLEPARHLPIYIPDPSHGARGIHQAVAEALGARPPHSRATLARLAGTLLDHELDERGRTPVLIVDEAHLLADRDLEALRLLTNTDMDAASSFALLLVGQPTLRRRLKLAVLSALDQRVQTRYTITGMTHPETKTYISRHLAAAGRREPLFADDAITVLHQASRGLPRAVNNLAATAMIAAYADRKALVDHASAQAAVADAAE